MIRRRVRRCPSICFRKVGHPTRGIGALTYWTVGEGPDVAICLNRACDFVVTRDAVGTAVPS